MAKLPSLPDNAHISDLFRAFPLSRDAMMAFTDVVMRGDGVLDIGTREMIAAYVSGLNRCTFCHGSHLIYAKAFGIDEAALLAALDDLNSAPFDGKTAALLDYIRKLNTLPSRITQNDIDAVLGAGWSQQAVFEAVQIAGLFNMMNRIIEGTGVSFDYSGDDHVHPVFMMGERITEHRYGGGPMGDPHKP